MAIPEQTSGPTTRRQFSVAATRESRPGRWKMLMAVGVLFCVLGLALLIMPLAGTLAVNFLVAAAFLLAGLFQVIEAFQDRQWSGFFLSAAWGVLYALAGLFMLSYPLGGAMSLTLVVSILFFAEGIISLVLAARMRPHEGWGWLAFSGVCSILIATLITVAFPSSALWAVGILVGINMITTGAAIAMLSLQVRRLGTRWQRVS